MLRTGSSRRRGHAVAALLACLAVVLVGTASAQAATGNGSPAPIYGVTIDEVTGLQEIVGSLSALPYRPTTRVYFDAHEPASYYAQPLAQIHRVSGVMGELLDSSDEKSISTAAFQERVQSYVS